LTGSKTAWKTRFCNSLAGSTVTIHEHLDGAVSIRYRHGLKDRAVGLSEERSRLFGAYYAAIEWPARVVADLVQVAGSRKPALFEQLMKRSEELRLDVKRTKNKLFNHRKQHGC
jgi:hypothetical protein